LLADDDVRLHASAAALRDRCVTMAVPLNTRHPMMTEHASAHL
jgi:hypothetical protein